MTRLATACLLGCGFWTGGIAQGQIVDPLVPNPLPVSAPIFPALPEPVSTPLPPPVSVPAPVVLPTPTRNPIGNPIGNPIQTPIGNVIGNPIQTPIGNVIGNPIQTPDVTAVGGGQGQQRPQQSQGNLFGSGGQGGQSGGGQNQPSMRVYVGTYTNDKSKSEGIYQFTFDPNEGKLTNQVVAAQTTNPSHLAIHPSRKFLYAVSEVGHFHGENSGAVSAYAIDPKEGKLAFLNTESSGGGDPCYVTVDSTGSDVLVANYSGGSVRVLPVGPDGKLGTPTATIQHQGSSLNKDRQTGPHAHSVDVTPNQRYAVVADLGLDKLLVYHFNPKEGTLKPNIPQSERLAAGAGPRHLAFHPDGRHAYVINEMASTITLFDFDGTRGTFSALETVHTRPDPKKSNNATAEIAVHPSGRFVYGSNRGDNTIAIYSVERTSGRLTPVGYQPTGGKTPRNFAIDPSGQFLLVGNQDSNTITIFRVDQQSGRLYVVGDPVPCPAPVCIVFTPMGDQ